MTENSSPPKKKHWSRALPWLSVLLTLLAYLPVVNNQFVNWDDPNYIQFNPVIRSLAPQNLWSMVSNFHSGYWIPLTWLSYALDFQLGLLEPWIYHLDNLILHGLNTLFVFFLSLKLFTFVREKDSKLPADWPVFSAFGGSLLFGLHPLHVESIAWAAERKDLLCGLFFLSSLLVYMELAARPTRKKYSLCLGLFFLALISKPMAVSLPLVFILLDYWPFRRSNKFSSVFLEKTPFFLTALLAGWVAFLSQTQVGASWGLNQSPLSFRIMNACHSLIFYLFKLLVPVKLAAFYPILLEKTFSPDYFFSLLGVLLITFGCFIYRKKKPFLLTAWLFYVITLGPVLGLVQVGNQAAGDRFTYIPSLAPILLASGVFFQLLSQRRLILGLLGILGAGFLGYGTFQQSSVWKDSITLWENTLRVCPLNNLIVHQNLGKAYEDAGRHDEALSKYRDAQNPDHNFLQPLWGEGRVLSAMGRLDFSIKKFREALALNPHFPPLHSDLGMVYQKKGLEKEAMGEIQEAIRLDTNYAEAYNHLGIIYRSQGQEKESLEAFQKALFLDPDNPVYLRECLKTCQATGNFKEALNLYKALSSHSRPLLASAF